MGLVNWGGGVSRMRSPYSSSNELELSVPEVCLGNSVMGLAAAIVGGV